MFLNEINFEIKNWANVPWTREVIFFKVLNGWETWLAGVARMAELAGFWVTGCLFGWIGWMAGGLGWLDRLSS